MVLIVCPETIERFDGTDVIGIEVVVKLEVLVKDVKIGEEVDVIVVGMV